MSADHGERVERPGGPGVIVRAAMPCSPHSPRRARELARSALEGRASPTLVDVVVLLISELVTNAVVHARTPVELVVTFTPGVVRAEVSDHGLGPVPAAVPGQPLDEGGRGLRLVEALATTWGCQRGPDGVCVWFEVAVET